MASRDNAFSSRASRIVIAVTVATSFCAAVAAAPSSSVGKEVVEASLPVPVKAAFGDSATALQPLGRGPAIRIGRAYDPEDEDCILAVTKVEDAYGRVSVTRGVACAD